MPDYLDTTTHNVAWFREAAEKGELIIRPAFQRKLVWLDPQKSFLIDSMLRGYPVPELYVQETVDEFGEQRYTVVDGQQRIRSCLDFIDGRFALGGWPGTPADREALYAGQRFAEIPAAARKRLFEYKFVVRTLPDMPEQALRVMFARLNRNVLALSRQELRHSIYWGPFIKLIEDSPKMTTGKRPGYSQRLTSEGWGTLNTSVSLPSQCSMDLRIRKTHWTNGTGNTRQHLRT